MKTYLLSTLSLGALLAACTTTPSGPGNAGSRPATAAVVKDSVTGSVTYRDRMALPPTAVVQVQLQDVSLQDVAATIIDSVTIRPNGRQVPLPFTLHYDTARIRPTNTYVVQAYILLDGRILYRTDAAYPVLTRGNPKQATLVLRRSQ